MTTIYEGMDDATLATEIADLTAATKAARGGGEIEEVRGENRALKYTRANSKELRLELNAALREKERRGPNFYPGNALYVEHQ